MKPECIHITKDKFCDEGFKPEALIKGTHQVIVILEGKMEVGDPAPVTKDEDIAFLLEAGRLGALQHLPLVEYFHSVDLVGASHPHNANFPKRTAPYHLDDLEVLPGQPQLFHACWYRFHY